MLIYIKYSYSNEFVFQSSEEVKRIVNTRMRLCRRISYYMQIDVMLEFNEMNHVKILV